MDLPNKTQNLQLYAVLERVIQQARFGQINLSLQIHDGKAVYLIGNNFEHRQYKEDGATEALEEFLTRVKNIRIARRSGTFTATFKFHGGKVKELLLQSNFKNQL